MGGNVCRREFLRASGGIGLAGLTAGNRRAAESGGTATVAVVSQHHRATEAGLDVLEAGGTAADAAVAVAGALSVVEPWFSSALGGGTWALYYEAETGEISSLDGVGPVGSDASVEDFEDRAGEPGIHQAIVPGAWDGWMRWLEAFGTMDLDSVLDPAIRIAREGYEVSSGMARWLDREADQIDDRPDAAAIYAPDGELLEAGDTVYQYDMADTFEALAEAYTAELEATGDRSEAFQGARDYFYRGPIADAIVDYSDEHGGYLTVPDFEEFAAELVEPLSIEYTDGVRVYQNPPNSQGITQLLALNTLKGFDLSALGPDHPDAVHVQVEAIKLAFADRHFHVGDPDRVEVPVAELLDDGYADSQRERIDTDEAMAWPIESGLVDSAGRIERRSRSDGPPHTSTFHVLDGDGNAAAVTTSLGAQFLVIGDTGIHINNRMRMVALEDDDPNRLTPGYKVRHTSNPYLATRNGEVYVCGGTTGVDTQPQGQTQQFVNVVDFGFTAQEAIDRPRFVSSAFPETQYPYEAENRLQIESGYSDDVIDELEARGHDVSVDTGSYGTANAIVVDETVQVGAESRTDAAEGAVVELSE